MTDNTETKTGAKANIIDILKNVDRRYIFLFILLAVIVPILFPLNLPIGISAPVRNIYEFIENLPEGSVIMISFDYSPSTEIELDPAAEALLRHAFRKKHKVIAIALWPMGLSQAQRVFAKIEKEFPEVEQGKDYVNLGYKAGGSVILMGLKEGFSKLFPTNDKGTPVADLPLMNKVKDISNVDLVISLSAGVPGIKEYVAIVNTQFGKPVAGACTAVSAPEMYTFLNSGQLLGLMGGLKGAAEYEQILKKPGNASLGMDAQSIVHIVIVLFIIFSNVVYFMDEHQKKQLAQK